MILELAQAAGNRLLELDPETSRHLGELAGKVFEIEVTGLKIKLYLIPTRQGVQLLRRWDTEADVKLRGSPMAFGRLLSEETDPTLFSESEVHIEGDVELGQRMSQILKRIDIDWEEQLSHFVGDIAAHQIGNVGRDVVSWARKARSKFALDTAEYLQEEIRELAPYSRVERLLSGIDRLRSDVERLEQRIGRLSNLDE